MNRHDYAHHPGFADQLAAGFLVSTSLSNPGWKALICWHGLRRPVILITASPPSCSRVPRGRESRSIPRVVMFSPSCPGSTWNPCSPTSANSSAWMRWTCRRFGCVGSAATRDRCWTVTPVGVVALHSESRHQHDLVDDCLAEAVFTIAADGEHPSLLIGHPAKSPRLLPGEEPASESDGTPAGTLGADRLSAVEEVENAAGEKRSCLGVIGRQRTVGEV